MEETERPIIFVDSSVLVAAAISARGSARDLIVAGLRGELRLRISSLVLEETERNLSAKAPAALPLFAVVRESLEGDLVDPPGDLVVEVAKVVEPKDAPIVAAALVAQAWYLATYDRKHLLRQKEQIEAEYPIRIMMPSEIVDARSGEP